MDTNNNADVLINTRKHQKQIKDKSKGAAQFIVEKYIHVNSIHNSVIRAHLTSLPGL